MKLGGICITTDNAPRLGEFYKIVLQKEPIIEGDHYGFGEIAIWNPGEVSTQKEKNIWLQCFDTNIDTLYQRLLREIPGIKIISPPQRKPWRAYAFWFTDPDGNRIAVAQISEEI